MSLFRDEVPTVGAIIFDPTKQVVGTGSGGIAAGLPAGSMWYDVTTGSFQSITGLGQVGLAIAGPTNVTAVTDTNPTTATALQTTVIPAGTLNVVGKTISVTAAGVYTTDANTARTITIAGTLGAVSMFSFTTGATTASQTGFPWQLFMTMVVTTKGSSGVLTVNGQLAITLGSSIGGAQTIYGYSAASSAVDLTVAETFSMTALFSGSNAGNTITENILQVVAEN